MDARLFFLFLVIGPQFFHRFRCVFYATFCALHVITTVLGNQMECISKWKLALCNFEEKKKMNWIFTAKRRSSSILVNLPNSIFKLLSVVFIFISYSDALDQLAFLILHGKISKFATKSTTTTVTTEQFSVACTLPSKFIYGCVTLFHTLLS